MLAQSKALEFAIHTLFNVGHLYYRLFFAYGVAALALDVCSTFSGFFGAAGVKPMPKHVACCSKGRIQLGNESTTVCGPCDDAIILSHERCHHRLCLGSFE